MSNFYFLKQVDNDLFEIISEAESLYRDEYFDQSMTQARRFAENVCKNVLGDKRTTEKTFDDMLATLKDKASAVQEKEFIEDLYFLKREGNNSTHSLKIKKDGIVALECLQRAFEIAINYSVHYKKAQSKLLKLRYDTELLITGKKSKETLATKYQKEKSKTKILNKKNQTKKQKIVLEPKKNSIFKNFVLFSISVSLFLMIMLLILLYI